MDAVGADHIRRLDDAAVIERRFGVSGVGDDRDASLVQRDGVGLERANRVGEEAMQIGAVQHEMRRAESLDAFVAEIEPVPGFAGAPVPQLAALRPNLHVGEGRFQAEGKQDASAIGADLDAGADFLELVRLFVNFNIDAALEQGKRRGQSTDAGADDNDLFRRAHEGLRIWREIVRDGGRGLIGISRRKLSPPRSSAEFPPRQKPQNPATRQF
jgi:hypothetical protein